VQRLLTGVGVTGVGVTGVGVTATGVGVTGAGVTGVGVAQGVSEHSPKLSDQYPPHVVHCD
jgi:hypothetical protein